MGSNKYIITKIKCWPVFKQDPQMQLQCSRQTEHQSAGAIFYVCKSECVCIWHTASKYRRCG